MSIHFRARLEKEREIAASAKAHSESGKQEHRDAQLAQLVASNKELNRKLEPFVQVAKALYPDLPPHEGLKRLEDRLANVEARTTAVEGYINDRHLTPEQIAILESMLSSKPQTISMVVVANDAEADEYSAEIRKVLESAGWHVNSHYAFWAPGFKGIRIVLPSVESVPMTHPGVQLLQAFQQAKLPLGTPPAKKSEKIDASAAELRISGK